MECHRRVCTSLLVFLFLLCHCRCQSQLIISGCDLSIDGPSDGLDTELKNLTSPNFPEAFPDGEYNCTYFIRNVAGGALKLVFTDFLLEAFSHDPGECGNRIVFEDSTGHTLQFCGNGRPPAMKSFSDTIVFRFMALGNEAKAAGFRLSVNFDNSHIWPDRPLVESDIKQDTAGCLAFIGTYGTRGNHVDITWIVVGPKGSKVSLRIDNLTLEYADDSHNALYILDGVTSVSRTIASLNIGDFRRDPGSVYDSRSNAMYIRLTCRIAEQDMLIATYVDYVNVDPYRGECPQHEGVNFFKCLNTRCIDESLVCDNKDHCFDNSDEIGCEMNCRYNGGCTNGGTCDNTTGRCDCIPGFYGDRCDIHDPYNGYGDFMIIGAISATILVLVIVVFFLCVAWGSNKTRTRQRLRTISRGIRLGRERNNSSSSQQPGLDLDLADLEPQRVLQPPPYSVQPPTYNIAFDNSESNVIVDESETQTSRASQIVTNLPSEISLTHVAFEPRRTPTVLDPGTLIFQERPLRRVRVHPDDVIVRRNTSFDSGREVVILSSSEEPGLCVLARVTDENLDMDEADLSRESALSSQETVTPPPATLSRSHCLNRDGDPAVSNVQNFYQCEIVCNITAGQGEVNNNTSDVLDRTLTSTLSERDSVNSDGVSGLGTAGCISRNDRSELPTAIDTSGCRGDAEGDEITIHI
ncbi:uncharacterized protein [Ptychodera flava]|uniref:uncharacterized protein n=1 Tax=Ptychodera flava TaxID=63121 RepID=UPI00396A38E7